MMYRVNVIDSTGEWQQQFNSEDDAKEFYRIKLSSPDVTNAKLFDDTKANK